MKRTCIAIDLKSFYASAECQERGLDPLDACLVVADEERTDKTICLAVSPALKSFGIRGRPRLFEVKREVKKINAQRRRKYGKPMEGMSASLAMLQKHPELELAFTAAIPQMALYMQYSRRIYEIYLRFVAPEDIFVYSIDEVFIDAASYLHAYDNDALRFTNLLVHTVLAETGITATAGIAPNLYLAKVAMDIEAKHMKPDQYGARIAVMDEMSYRYRLWDHQPLTDFWRIGRGTAKRLAGLGIHTMGDLAEHSFNDQKALYEAFGVNAELLIDHAWGYEPTLISDIQHYEPLSSSLSVGQVLPSAYTKEEGALIVREMADSLSFQLVDKGLVTDHVNLYIGFDGDMVRDPSYEGGLYRDFYGRLMPQPVNGSASLAFGLNASEVLMKTFMEIYERIVPDKALVRRVNLAASTAKEGEKHQMVQMNLFETEEKVREEEKMRERAKKEEKAQKAILVLRQKYGAEAVIRGMDKQKKATAIARSRQIGGHRR